MKKNILQQIILASLLLIITGLTSCQSKNIEKPTEVQPQKEILPSWNDGTTKTAIIDFVTKITKEGTPDFIPVEDRIATFDNDGTLWAEQPVIQLLFVFYQTHLLAAEKPEIKTKQPFKAVLDNDEATMKKFTEKDFLQLVGATLEHKSLTEFQKEAKDFFVTAKYPGRDVPMSQMRYQPQLELLEYLRDNGFTIYICTGGTTDFVRVISKEFYGINPEFVIGTTNKFSYQDDGSINDLVFTSGIASFNDKAEKPVNIAHFIGKRPVLACGNEGGGGDVYMLRYSQGHIKYPTLQLIVNHNDKDREYEYYENPDVSLTWAKKYNWNVISMKDDWKQIFPKQ